ncbi:MAG: thiamine-phosphate kinase [Flavobacteriales bacterium]|jgi:thiamine-monophosphate kinase|nr:thiamine-phosphate kinase [Flavobacteriaceae bacterium]MDO7581956.1 thiamine-phosphate kinase [Flavobacteriaceae bacterium]MDO7591242.1 thiamine-phosphate kinase [Flavobacteriaceae bacterium]MDO7604003.1 thiamine-phosphate kinase [Flavobacteriaceae bacterium]MDO7615605.1 thiamine-phosphate kinase [Flavobacteriaceae bacterium]|tara:strand:+ start:151 stop:1203 length:1053 start_codon:yes stop_codon:yes gene_type:complete
MLEDKNIPKTPVATLGEFELIKTITKEFKINEKSTQVGIGDDAAVIQHGKEDTLVSTDLLIEGVHFDLSYMPLKHLGYKAVMVNLSDIYAMNGIATQITFSLAFSNRFPLEAIEELYAGIYLACKNYKVDLVGGDTTSSTTGLMLSVTAIGKAPKKEITQRSGAKEGNLVVVTGDLGGAYMGLQVLEREKAVFQVNPQSQPDLSEYSYCIERQLKPEARTDIKALLNELDVKPTSMIDISDGLSSEILHISKASKLGCQIYEDKIPIDPEVGKTCEEFKINNTTAALNGGEDYELLFTIEQNDFEKVKGHPHLSVIGHMTDQASGYNMVTGLGQQIELTAQGWNGIKSEE